MKSTLNFSTDNYDAFISYKHQSGFYMAQVIYDKLIQNGYSVFMDKHLKRGEFEDQIKAAVEKSCNFILVLTLNSGRKIKPYVRLEKYVVDVLRVRRPRTLSTSPTYWLF